MTEQKDNRGGARKGAGRKAEDGATGLVPKTFKLTPEQKAWCDEVGQAHIRHVIEQARIAYQQESISEGIHIALDEEMPNRGHGK